MIHRVGQNRIYTPYKTVYIYIWWFFCQKYRIYIVYICFWPTLHMSKAVESCMYIVWPSSVLSVPLLYCLSLFCTVCPSSILYIVWPLSVLYIVWPSSVLCIVWPSSVLYIVWHDCTSYDPCMYIVWPMYDPCMYIVWPLYVHRMILLPRLSCQKYRVWWMMGILVKCSCFTPHCTLHTHENVWTVRIKSPGI